MMIRSKWLGFFLVVIFLNIVPLAIEGSSSHEIFTGLFCSLLCSFSSLLTVSFVLFNQNSSYKLDLHWYFVAAFIAVMFGDLLYGIDNWLVNDSNYFFTIFGETAYALFVTFLFLFYYKLNDWKLSSWLLFGFLFIGFLLISYQLVLDPYLSRQPTPRPYFIFTSIYYAIFQSASLALACAIGLRTLSWFYFWLSTFLLLQFLSDIAIRYGDSVQQTIPWIFQFGWHLSLSGIATLIIYRIWMKPRRLKKELCSIKSIRFIIAVLSLLTVSLLASILWFIKGTSLSLNANDCALLMVLMLISWTGANVVALVTGIQLQNLSEMSDTDENTISQTSSFEDINRLVQHHKIITREMKEMYSSLDVSKRLLESITFGVAHDIRSPLSSIQSAVGLLRSSSAPKEEALNLLDLGAQRLTNIANGLLDRHKDGDAKKMVFSLHKVLDELVGEIKSSPQNHDIQMIKNYDSALSCYGDRTQVMRAFGNILKNGCEAMKGEGVIHLKSFVEGEYAVIEIKDNGPGMNAETLAKMLKGGHSSGKQDGHGIGMKVVREVIESHLGILEAQSILGQGTTFTIKLPLPGSSILKNAEAIEQGVGTYELVVAPFNSSLPLGRESERGGERNGEWVSQGVVVIDDDAGMRLQWELLLKREGIKVYSFDSGESYLKNKPKETIRTAIIDFHFENSPLNGIDILKGLKEENYTHLTLCTAEYWKPGLQEEAKSLGVRICPKPLPRVVVKIPPHPPLKKGGIAMGLPPLTKGERGGFEDGYRVLVIDDDPLIRTTWKLSKKLLKIKELYAFESFEAFSHTKVDPSLVDMAFVDKNIEGSEFDGDQAIKKLKESGFKNVHMKSGEQSGGKIPEKLEEYVEKKV